MKFALTLTKGRLVRRYKRFLADVELENGEVITAHTANSGSMMGLVEPGNPVYLSFHDKPTRRLKHSWEIVSVGSTHVGVNTSLPNHLVAEGIQQNIIKELQGYAILRREVPYGASSRIDLLLEDPERKPCYVEVKNVTLARGETAYFPDAVSTRGQKHMKDLMAEVKAGNRAVIFFVIQREDVKAMGPADFVDPEYGRLLREAVQNGVEALVYQARVTPEEIRLSVRLPLVLD